MRHFSTACLVAFVAMSTAVYAETFPEPKSKTINDFADMLSPESEARMTETLVDLARDTGVEATIVTLSSVKFYANDMTVAEYATALFNNWGVGDADKGDGVLLIVFRDDSQLRLETGAGYDAAAQDRAADIVSEVIIPAFQHDDYEEGIEAGAIAIADQLVRNIGVVTTPDAPVEGGGGNGLWWLLGIIGVPVVALVAWSKARAAKLAATPCPSCGKTGLRQDRVVLNEATDTTTGNGETRTICTSCGHTTAVPFTIAKKTPPKEKKPAFDGGKSDGGGASGKW